MTAFINIVCHPPSLSG